MNEIIVNWVIYFVVTVAGFIVGWKIREFIKLTSPEKVSKVKEWLVYATMQAERELGGGTGKLKLRYVYDMFLSKFPAIAAVISFETFSSWVDEALEEFKNILANSPSASHLIK